MQKLFLLILSTVLFTTMAYAAPPDEGYVTGQVGRLMFQYPEHWIGTLMEEEGLVALADSEETLVSVFDGGTPEPGQVAVAILNEDYLEDEYSIDTDTASLAEIAETLSQDTGQDEVTYTIPGEGEIEGKPTYRMDGESSDGLALTLLIVDTGNGIAGLGLVAAAGQIREYELILQNIAASLEYISEENIGFAADAPLTRTYISLSQARLTFDYPEGAVMIEEDGVIGLANSETGLDSDTLASGEVLIAFFTPLFYEESLQITGDPNAAELMEAFQGIFTLDDTVEMSETEEIQIGDRTGYQVTFRGLVEPLDVILVTLDTPDGDTIAGMLVAPTGEMEAYENLFFSILETVNYLEFNLPE